MTSVMLGERNIQCVKGCHAPIFFRFNLFLCGIDSCCLNTERFLNSLILVRLMKSFRISREYRYVYILRLIGPISYLGACYIRTTVTKCIREKMTLYFRR